MARKYVKTKIGINPQVFLFRQKSNPKHSRKVFGTRCDEVPDSWAVHSKVATPGRNYIRHVTEWFEKALWSKHEPLVKRRKGILAATPFAPPVATVAPVEAPKPVVEAPKPAPAITFVDDDDDTEEIPVAAVTPPAPKPVKSIPNINEELPGEYNPRAHKEKVFGSEEDLIVLDDIVNSNYIAQRRKEKLMQLRAKQEGRSMRPSPANPIVAGFEPG